MTHLHRILISSKRVNDLISKFSWNKNDYEWLSHYRCKVHGNSCPCEPTITQSIETVYVVLDKDETKVAKFVNLYFHNIDENLRNKLISVVYTSFVHGERQYSHIDYSPGGSIEATLIQTIGSVRPDGLSVEAAIGLVTYKKQICRDHVWLGEYYRSNEKRIINALKYMFYENTIQKIEIASNPRIDL